MEVLYGIVFIFVLTAAYGAYSAAPWVPTKSAERRHLVANLQLKGNETVYDLGCGDGSLLFNLVDAYPGVRVIGYEVALLPLMLGWVKKIIFFQRYRRVSLRFGNLFKAKISDADLVFVFLMAKVYPKLIHKFRQELAPEALVAVEAWPLPGVVPSSVIADDGLLSVYIYKAGSLKQ